MTTFTSRRRHARPIIAAILACAIGAWAGSLALAGPARPRTASPGVVPVAAIDVANTTIGFADSDLYFKSPADVEKTLDMMQTAGVHTIRVLVPWAGVQPTADSYDWTRVDTIVAAAQARGMGIVGLLTSTPQWAAQPGQPALSSPPASDSTYASFAAAVATRYAGRIGAYEVWNEPNANVFWSTGANAAQYVDLLRAAYPALKAADPDAIVLAGALSPLAHPSGSVSAVDFLRDMYDAGAKGYFDALSYHPYTVPTAFSQGAYEANSAYNQLIRMRRILIANGDATKLIWATEYGLPTDVVGEQTQAGYVFDFLDRWRTLQYVGPAFIYSTQDSPINAKSFGVFRADWTAKLAVGVIQYFTGSASAATTTRVAILVASRSGLAGVPRLIGTAITHALTAAATSGVAVVVAGARVVAASGAAATAGVAAGVGLVVTVAQRAAGTFAASLASAARPFGPGDRGVPATRFAAVAREPGPAGGTTRGDDGPVHAPGGVSATDSADAPGPGPAAGPVAEPFASAAPDPDTTGETGKTEKAAPTKKTAGKAAGKPGEKKVRPRAGAGSSTRQTSRGPASATIGPSAPVTTQDAGPHEPSKAPVSGTA